MQKVLSLGTREQIMLELLIPLPPPPCPLINVK